MKTKTPKTSIGFKAIISCDNCRFCEKSAIEVGGLECRRYPPSMMKPYQPRSNYIALVPIECQFPAVNGGEWCGEWQPAMDRDVEMWRVKLKNA